LQNIHFGGQNSILMFFRKSLRSGPLAVIIRLFTDTFGYTR